MLPRLAVTAGALAFMFGFGSLWTGSGRPEPPSSGSAVGIKSSLTSTGSSQPIAPVGETRPDILPVPNSENIEQTRTGSADSAIWDKNGDKFFCGALTKKGTPCSRKVKGKGLRCFQHEGRPGAPTSE